MKEARLTFLRKNLNFGLDENQPTRLTSQTSSDKIFRHKDTKGTTTEEQPSKSNPKIWKEVAPYFSKKTLNFGLDKP
jgi:hypothetical protein